jgi:aconitate hydratase
VKYREERTPLIVLAGKEYGTGSSRDWAAKGPLLLGVQAVIAESFERIHRTNLVGMGILPLQYRAGETATSLGLDGRELYELVGINEGIAKPNMEIQVQALSHAGKQTTFWVKTRLDTPIDIDVYKQGGILQAVLRQLATK